MKMTKNTKAAPVDDPVDVARAEVARHNSQDPDPRLLYRPKEPNLPGRMIGGQQGGAPLVVDARGPRHERLRAEARALRTQAAQGRFLQPQKAGMLEADTVEDLFAAVHADAMRVGPAVDAMVAWS